MKTILYRILDSLNDHKLISDKTFYYLLDTLPWWITIPPSGL